MSSVVFSTPGLIPIEAFTTFGMSAKPESTNPFGKFGTGLKIAVAVCLRLGQEVIVWRGEEKYTFFTKKHDFRGKEFMKVRMKKEVRNLNQLLKKPFTRSYHDLPFTIELGKHWELWQAFREFQTNTMDENGWTFVIESPGVNGPEDANMTRIQVTGAKFVDEYYDRGRNFLEGGLTVREDSTSLQVLDKPSRHIYFRGVRVCDLKEEAAFTYNFVRDIELTEDRTAKYPSLLESWICDHIMQSEDPAFLKKAVIAPAEGSWESSLPYRYTNVTPSRLFTTSVRASSFAPAAAKEKVKVIARPKIDITRLRVRIPKKLSKAEITQLHELINGYFTGTELEDEDEVFF